MTENYVSCDAVDERGRSCVKRQTLLSDGEWAHGGGHIFSTPEVAEKVATWHYDAGDFLAGKPVEAHPPDKCPGPDECLTARYSSRP